MQVEDLRYPIGKFSFQAPSTADQRQIWIAEIAESAAKFRAAVAGLTGEQINTPYREGGWTVRQVIHHVPDSHLNAYVRFKLALTESEPTIKPYDEAAWAELSDTRDTPIEVSLALLENLHARWVVLLRSLTQADLDKRFDHPERGVITLDFNIAMFAWHCKHHAGTSLLCASGTTGDRGYRRETNRVNGALGATSATSGEWLRLRTFVTIQRTPSYPRQ
jgi:hypothetical protein